MTKLFTLLIFFPIVLLGQSIDFLKSLDSLNYCYENKIPVSDSLIQTITQDEYCRPIDLFVISRIHDFQDSDQGEKYYNLALSKGLAIDDLTKTKYYPKLKKDSISLFQKKQIQDNSRLGHIVDDVYWNTFFNQLNLRDQKYRSNHKGKLDASDGIQMENLDKVNQDSLKLFLNQHGWPKKSQWPEKIGFTAWLIAQHADNDIQFQKECLSRMKELLISNDLDVKNYPYLVDRILINNCERQLYGTQFWLMYNEKGIPESIEFKPIKDSQYVDKRRKYFNQIPLKYYRSQALRRYKKKYDVK